MPSTARLELSPPTGDDDEAQQLHAVYSSPAVWEHFPTGRFTDPAQTRCLLAGWRRCWDDDGLGPWLVRLRGTDRVVGNAGVALRDGVFWNLGYRLAGDVHGHGYAGEACRAALREAQRVRPDVPVVAHLLEHNTRSVRLAERLGLRLVHRGPDAGDPDAVRLVYADRPLDPAVVLTRIG